VPLAPGACANVQSGTPGNDTLLGTAFGDLLRGIGGADTLRGRRGRDCLNGGRGGDDLFGGRGNDRLVGGPGDDTLACGPGRDVAVVSGPDDFFGCERVRRALGLGLDQTAADRVAHQLYAIPHRLRSAFSP
jgi:RTX calcium-binding nonapeptide repeat (4 copies)